VSKGKLSSARVLALAVASTAVLALAPMMSATASASGSATPSRWSTAPVRASQQPGTVPGSPAALGTNVNVTNKAGAQSETAVAVDPTNPKHVLSASNDLVDTAIVYESFDGGATWANAGLSLASFCYDPWLDFNAAGDAFFSYECSDQRYAYRIHGTSTWVQTKFPSSLVGSFPDRDMIVLDTNSASPFFNSAYIGYDDNGAGNIAYVVYSRDGKTGWTRSPKINDSSAGTIGVNVAVGADGTIYASWLDYANKKLMMDKSTDGGAHWGTDHLVHTYRLNTATFFITIPPTPQRGIVPFPLSVGAPAGSANAGRLYEIYTDKGTTGSDTNIYFTYSDDGGTTWSAEKLLNDDGGAAYQFFGSIAVSASGVLGVAFYDTRRDATSKKTDRFITFSGDGGTTWTPNHKITTAQSDESGFGDSNDYGDYEGLDAGATNVFYNIWTDSRPGTQAEDMYFALVRAR
jgi:hypothetical protein